MYYTFKNTVLITVRESHVVYISYNNVIIYIYILYVIIIILCVMHVLYVIIIIVII